MDATIFVQFSGDRTLSSAGYAAKLRSGLHDDPQFADLGFRFASHDTPAPVNIRLSGGKTAERRRLAEEVRRRLATVKGAVDVEIVQRMDAPYVSVRVERRKAAEVGLSPAEVASQVSAALGLRVPFEHSVWGDNTDGEYSFSVPFPKEPSVNLADALDTNLTGVSVKQPVKLSSVAAVRREMRAVEIDHHSLLPVCDVQAAIEDRSRSEAVAEIRGLLQELPLPEGIGIELAD